MSISINNKQVKEIVYNNKKILSIFQNNKRLYGVTKKALEEMNRLKNLGYNLETKTFGNNLFLKVFYHFIDVDKNLFTESECPYCNTENKFSILGSLESFRLNETDKFEFVLDYTEDLGTYQQWKQTSNPCVYENEVIGYEPVHIVSTDNYWGGLARKDTEYEESRNCCYIEGSIGHWNWWYAIGQYEKWCNSSKVYGIPAYGDNSVQHVSLYVRIK